MIGDNIVRKHLENTLEKTDFTELGSKYEGKVRDNYTQGDKRVIITTDRISAFDRVLGTIPFKGQTLNGLASFWFDKTKHIVRNHMIDSPDPNVMVVSECKPIPVEMVVRGYITGVTKTSAWYNYSQGVRNFCGVRLPEGLKKDQKFGSPILTPTTKAEHGDHDRSISPREIISEGILSKDMWEQLKEISFKLYDFGVRQARKNGLILVDTKYEFGLIGDEIVLMDEIHTPDSSRFWFADTYQELFEKGEEQRKLDKEYVRTWLADQGFRGDGTPPKLTDGIRAEAAKRYIRAFEIITGEKFTVVKKPVIERIRENLRIKGYLKR
ncbi:MAG: phosphoribosylaminoimidazolesuccinocarboxamide synthase [Candidatus Aenigmatarchaeota archaeon]|nr:MAG: phosphoribosylaminoimidazolesuccinocarboxamide synthase [Candidatus Aenigmarchaeota archaeon]